MIIYVFVRRVTFSSRLCKYKTKRKEPYSLVNSVKGHSDIEDIAPQTRKLWKTLLSSAPKAPPKKLVKTNWSEGQICSLSLSLPLAPNFIADRSPRILISFIILDHIHGRRIMILPAKGAVALRVSRKYFIYYISPLSLSPSLSQALFSSAKFITRRV